MAELAVVRRYARALFEMADRNGKLDQVEEDLRSLDALLRSVPGLHRILRAPTLSAARKKRILGETIGPRLDPLTRRFVDLIVDQRRETVLSDVYPEFQRLANERRNILPVRVTAPLPLTDTERDDLVAALSRRTGKRIELEVSVDPSILGGLVLRMGDTVVDGSVRTRLEQLRHRLAAGLPA